jgi:hypothetical protein
MQNLPDMPDIKALDDALDAAERDARELVTGLSEVLGTWRADAGSWSVAECLDHLATANRVYLRALEPPAARALAQGRRRRRAAQPGVLGGWFVRYLEPPVPPRSRIRAPRKIRPRSAPPLHDAATQFFASQDEVRAFIRQYAAIDLAGVHFPNPFIRGLRFSLATGLHVIAAHERRHLWQARNIRHAAEQATTASCPA